MARLAAAQTTAKATSRSPWAQTLAHLCAVVRESNNVARFVPCRDTAAVTGPALPRLLRPRALRPGDLVVIASLSGPLHAAYEPDLEQAVVVLERMGFRVRRAPLLEAGRHHWWSAATPAEIAAEFNALAA